MKLQKSIQQPEHSPEAHGQCTPSSQAEGAPDNSRHSAWVHAPMDWIVPNHPNNNSPSVPNASRLADRNRNQPHPRRRNPARIHR